MWPAAYDRDVDSRARRACLPLHCTYDQMIVATAGMPVSPCSLALDCHMHIALTLDFTRRTRRTRVHRCQLYARRHRFIAHTRARCASRRLQHGFNLYQRRPLLSQAPRTSRRTRTRRVSSRGSTSRLRRAEGYRTSFSKRGPG